MQLVTQTSARITVKVQQLPQSNSHFMSMLLIFQACSIYTYISKKLTLPQR